MLGIFFCAIMTHLKVKITPSSSKNAFLSWLGDELKVALQAPPEKGKANQALVKFMAQSLGLCEAQIEIIRGATQAHKTLQIDISPNELAERLPKIPRQNRDEA